MKVKIGNYKHYFGPYQLAEVICFWTRNKYEKPDYVSKLGEWLAHGSIEPDVEHKPGDIYSLGGRDRKNTILSNFLLWIDDKRERTIKVKLDRWDTYSADNTRDLDDNAEARWEWVLNEMIFAFESKVSDGAWEDQFYTGEYGDIFVKQLADGNSELLPNNTLKIDREGLKRYQDRITNGFRLFGKYYESLWT